MKFPRGIEIVGGVIAERGDGKILVTKAEKWSNKWTLAGGHIEPGESIVEGSVREGEEELGLALEGVDIVHFGELIGPKDFHRPAHFLCFDVYARVKNDKEPKLNHEHQEYQWVSPEDALALDLAADFGDTIKAFIKYKKQ